MKETAGEELSRLRAENVDLKQLLTSKDAQLACKDAQLLCKDELLAAKETVIAIKDELLASRAAELQRCQELLQHRFEIVQTQVLATDSSKRQRLQYGGSPDSPLDRNDLLDHVFSYVGGEHAVLYTEQLHGV
jgi:hypothetical protein